MVAGSLLTGVMAQAPQPKQTKAGTKPNAGKKKTSTPASNQRSQTSNKPPQKKPTASNTKPKPTVTPKPIDPAVEKARFDEALGAVTPADKAALLLKFIAEFPKSDNKRRAQESLAVARAAMADEKLSAGDPEQSTRLFKLAVEEAPKPYSDRLFVEIITKIPANLFWKGQPQAAIDVARIIEANVAADPKQLISIANFYLETENGTEAKRIAEAAIMLDSSSAAAFQTLGMADRLNFDLEASESAFAKAVELDSNSLSARRMLAEMKRALGKAGDAESIYREILAKDENDTAAKTGLVLAMFDAGKKREAEAELARSTEQSAANVILLAGVAYWYASHNESEKAVDLARQAIAREPRFIWSHIALARGLMLQKKPVEAEQVLVAARKYGNFPTLQYEIASARLASGFYREAAEELSKSFTVENDEIRAKLGGRIERSSKDFSDLVSIERRASIFAYVSADFSGSAGQLRSLLEFHQLMSSEKPDETAAKTVAERFTSGSDEMAIHRKLFAAQTLLQKKIAPEKALEYARSATSSVDSALNVPNPAAAVMATELYEAREDAFFKGNFLLIPEVPKQTLSSILRGRIEETTGLAMLQSGNPTDAEVRFRRAISVLPKDSAWWRSATWNLGAALEAQGKDEEALKTYISSYKIDKPNISRYLVISSLYKKVNGKVDGLENEIGLSPIVASDVSETAEKTGTPTVNEKPSESSTEAKSLPEATPSPIQGERSPELEKPAVTATTPTPETTPSPSPQPALQTEDTPPTIVEKPATVLVEPSPSPSPEVTPQIKKADETGAPGVIAEKPKTEPAKEDTTNVAVSSSPKPLFEPIVIAVPRSAEKAESDKNTEAAEKPIINEKAKTDQSKEDPIANGTSRPRVVEGKEITGGEIIPCTIEASQESISLINNGGSIALLISASEGIDPKTIDARSNSIKDIEVRLEPEIAGVTGRSLYVIKSISENTGLFQVAFELPCGKKVVTVRVR